MFNLCTAFIYGASRSESVYFSDADFSYTELYTHKGK